MNQKALFKGFKRLFLSVFSSSKIAGENFAFFKSEQKNT